MHNKSSKNGSERFWPTPNTMDSLPARAGIEEANRTRGGRKNRVALSNLREAIVSPNYIPTSSPSTEPTTPGLTCSQGDFLANLSVSPGSDSARQMTVRSGLKCSELYKRQDPLGSLVRTLLGSSRWNSTISYLTWKASATPRGRLLFRLVPSMPDTDGTEFGLWPTPDTCAGGDGPSQQNRNGPRLQTAVKSWPTPNARDWKDTTAKSSINAIQNGAQMTLGRAAHMWPTPTANEDACGKVGGKMQAMLGNHPALGKTSVNGSLNPAWVEWLMGYPIGHTVCAGWVTRSARPSLKKSSEKSPA